MENVKELIENLTYGAGNVIARKDNYTLTKPLNTWDTNYRLNDEDNDISYLIDCDDIANNNEEQDEYGGILFEELILMDIELIKEIAWKTDTCTYY